MKLSAVLLGFVLSVIILFCGLAVGQTSQPTYTFDPVATCMSGDAPVVEIPGQEGVKGVQLPAEMGQFGNYDFDLKRTFPVGRYQLHCTLWSLEDRPARVAIYAGTADGSHLQITWPRDCPAGSSIDVSAYFYATSEFCRLVVKKMEDVSAPSQVVTKLVLTDTGQREYPRLEGYWMVMQYPAPWGLRSPVIEAKLDEARQIYTTDFGQAIKDLPEVEAWMDRRSVAADLCARADDLLRAVRLTKASGLNETTGAVGEGVEKLKLAVAQNRQTDMEQLSDDLAKMLDGLEAAVNEAVGGIVRPELGTDIFTWVKDWRLVGSGGAKEYSEPTPWRMAYDDQAVIRLMAVGGKVDLESSWTTSIYRGETMDVIYSVLTPMTVIKMKTNRLTVSTSGLAFDGDPASELKTRQRADLISATTRYVFLFDAQAVVRWSNGELVLEFEKPATVGLVRFGRDKSVDGETLDFYRALLANPPVQCVQIQRGRNVEQIFEGLSGPPSIAPVPHLVRLSQQPQSKLKVRFDAPVRTAAGGFAFVPDADRFSYELPDRRYAHTCGINVHDVLMDDNLYKELKSLGCRTIRLACGADMPWEADNPDRMKEMVQGHLRRAREAGGLTVGIDMHGLWQPNDLSNEKGFKDPALLAEFIRRWSMIISWCKPFDDVIGWYDLMNEPHIFYERESVEPFVPFMRKAIAALRPLAGETPFLVECVNMANSVGLEFWRDLGDENIIVGYHDYWPHMFTHQRCVEPGDPSMPAVFYPSFMPAIAWETPSWRSASPDWQYWDRWKCDQLSLPVMRLMIGKDLTFDCGEYGVVGYAGQTSPRSGVLWLGHTLERFARLGINHNAWGVSGGFTWNTPESRAELLRLWKRYADQSPPAAETPSP
ncbi:MAG: glycoside hydrolase family 5 protein [Phycisphaerae bacterium]|nr:glycoside hydrolase family 5 protein [Phycisphaerae bacterium]